MSRRIKDHLTVNIPEGPTFSDIASAPRRISERISHIEKIPILGNIVKGAEDLFPELAVARESLAVAVDVENVLKNTFGVDVEGIAREVDAVLDFSDHSNTVHTGNQAMLRGLNLVPIPRMEFQNMSHSHPTQVGDLRSQAQAGQSISQQ